MNLIGKTFGRLEVVANDEIRHGYVICRCECGRQTSIRKSSLTQKRKPTRSCGCIHKEIASEVGRRTIRDNSAQRIETNMRYNTNFQIIERNTPDKRNKSGYKGVWYNGTRGRYEAYIHLHRKRIHLGWFKSLEDAIDARQTAEKELYAPLIAAKYAENSEVL